MSVPISPLNIEDTSKSFTKESAQAIEDILQGLYLHPMLKAKVVHVPVQTTKIYERVQIIDDILRNQKRNNRVSGTTTIGTISNASEFYIDSAYVAPIALLGGKP